jgi:hypothetical protein
MGARILLLALFCLSPIVISRSQSFPDDQNRASSGSRGLDDPAKAITVKLLALRSSVRFGSPVLVRVEIYDVSKDSFFVPSSFLVNRSGDPAELQVRITDANGKVPPGPGSFGALDRFVPPKGDFHALVLRYWTVLSQGYCYGTTLDLTDFIYEAVKEPGRYLLSAKYSAFSMQSTNMNNPLGNYVDQVPTLPYPAWDGTIDAKPTWINLAPRVKARAGPKP